MKIRPLNIAALTLACALGASVAEAQKYPRLFGHPGKVVVDQRGQGNGAAVSQNGADDAARIRQTGAANTGQVIQQGDNNDAAIIQRGKGNDATITQTGDDNTACIVQMGRNLSADVSQSGGQSVGVVQTRKGSFEIPGKLCGMVGQGNPGHLRFAGAKFRY